MPLGFSSLIRRVIVLLPLLAPAYLPAQMKTGAPPEFIRWLPVSDADRALKAPIVEKDAGAEVLLWRVHVVDEVVGSDLRRAFYHYIRLKIFDEKGKEKAATIDISYREPGNVLDVSGRTIKADGTVLELEKKAIYKRDLIRAGGRKEKAVSFAMPGVEPGAIVEYRWRQTEEDSRFRYLPLHFQREFPVQKVTYFVKPLSRDLLADEQLFLMPLNSKPTPIQQESDGYNSTSLENVPAERDEPYSPSTPNLEPWALLYYRHGGLKDGDKFWEDEGRKVFKEWKDRVKIDGELKKSEAVEAAAAAKSADEKIAILMAALHKNVRNLFDPGVTTAEREKFFAKLPKERSRNSAEILKSGLATGDEMNVALGAMLEAAGMDTRPVLVADREEVTFLPKAMADRYFLNDSAVAIKSGTTWRVLDGASKFLDPGMLPWRHEGIFALIADAKTPAFVPTPVSTPDATTEKRTAQLRLLPDGSLEGDVTESFTGYRAEERRGAASRRSAAQREESLHDSVVRLFPDAEVTAIKLENLDDAAKPVLVSYHLKAPLYAQSTGKRLLFQPIPFHRSIGSPFTATERKLPIEFPYGWKEVDEIHIQLPEGYTLDNADAPANLNFGDPGKYRVTMTSIKGQKSELYTVRELSFGEKGTIMFPAASYTALKGVFDQISVRDGHTMSLIAK